MCLWNRQLYCISADTCPTGSFHFPIRGFGIRLQCLFCVFFSAENTERVVYFKFILSHGTKFYIVLHCIRSSNVSISKSLILPKFNQDRRIGTYSTTRWRTFPTSHLIRTSISRYTPPSLTFASLATKRWRSGSSMVPRERLKMYAQRWLIRYSLLPAGAIRTVFWKSTPRLWLAGSVRLTRRLSGPPGLHKHQSQAIGVVLGEGRTNNRERRRGENERHARRIPTARKGKRRKA